MIFLSKNVENYDHKWTDLSSLLLDKGAIFKDINSGWNIIVIQDEILGMYDICKYLRNL